MLVPETGGGMNTALLDPDPYILDNLTSSMTPYPFLSWTPNPKPYTLDQNAEQEGNLHEFFDSAGIEESVVGQVDALYGPGLQPHHTRVSERLSCFSETSDSFKSGQTLNENTTNVLKLSVHCLLS